MRIGSGRTRSGVTGTARWIGRGAILLGLCCILVGAVAPAAGANYARITAEARCDATVAWTASASSEGTRDERTNQKVTVEYRAAGTGGTWTMVDSAGSFDASNDFTFSGSFPMPTGVTAVELRVSPKVRWGADRDGAEAGGPRFATATVPAGCAAQPLVVTITPDCGAGGAAVSNRNVGVDPITASVTVDRISVRDLTIAPGATASVIVPILEGTSAAIRVNAGDFVVAQQEVRADCKVAGPVATITERCAARQAVVLAASGSDSNEPVEITVADAVIHQATLRPDQVLKRTIELPATGAVPIEVTIDGTVVASAFIGGCTGPVAGAVSCGSATGISCSATATPPTTVVEAPPPPPPPPLVIDLDGGSLPMTGPWQRAIVLFLGGALLTAGGAAMVVEQRRRPRPSLLAVVVAPYRQRWWDDLSDR